MSSNGFPSTASNVSSSFRDNNWKFYLLNNESHTASDSAFVIKQRDAKDKRGKRIGQWISSSIKGQDRPGIYIYESYFDLDGVPIDNVCNGTISLNYLADDYISYISLNNNIVFNQSGNIGNEYPQTKLLTVNGLLQRDSNHLEVSVHNIDKKNRSTSTGLMLNFFNVSIFDCVELKSDIVVAASLDSEVPLLSNYPLVSMNDTTQESQGDAIALGNEVNSFNNCLVVLVLSIFYVIFRLAQNKAPARQGPVRKNDTDTTISKQEVIDATMTTVTGTTVATSVAVSDDSVR